MSAFEKLPTHIQINGAECEINTDFRTVLTFLAMMDDDDIPGNYKMALMAEMFGVNSPSAVWEWINQGEKAEAGSVKVIDFQKDERYIYSAFLQEYGIDLYEIRYLHWYKFMYLLESLTDRCMLKQIMSIRATDISQIKDPAERERMRKLQNRYYIEDKDLDRLRESLNEEGW